MTHTTPLEAKDSFQASFDDVTENSERWMACVWRVTPEGRLQFVMKTTFNFPLDYLPLSQLQLKESNDKEIASNLLPNDPLPTVDIKSENNGVGDLDDV